MPTPRETCTSTCPRDRTRTCAAGSSTARKHRGMKLIHLGGRQYQLYDLASDPGEMVDIVDDAGRLEPMLQAFAAKRQSVSEIYVAPEGALP
jgi:arylsulfatase A-like enzyme